MPIRKYFGGDGRQVLADMIRRYGPKKGREVFYATAAKRKQRPSDYIRKGK